ncbi:MAG: ABC transporter permease [Fimbriimonas sp.]
MILKALGAIFALALLLALTLWAFGIPVLEGFRLMAEGAGADKFAWSRTLVKATPLLLTGLGMVVAWRGGMYNIGGEGQFIVGGLFSATLAELILTRNIATPPILAIPLLLILSALGGAVWAWLAGWLFVRRGVDVVISTILLNFVAIQFLAYAVTGPLREKPDNVPLTRAIPEAYMLWRPDRQMDLHAGVVIAAMMAIVIAIYLYRTKAGFNVRLAGESPRVARANRIDADKMRLQAMLVSGALCGLAGGIEYIGMARQLGTGFSQNWGFLGIPVALLSGLDPLLAMLSALLFGALFAGSENLARFTSAGPTLIYIVQAGAVLGIVALRAFRSRRVIQTPAT